MGATIDSSEHFRSIMKLGLSHIEARRKHPPGSREYQEASKKLSDSTDSMRQAIEKHRVMTGHEVMTKHKTMTSASLDQLGAGKGYGEK